ncbi:beta-1,3-galactosyltransferase brn-like [Argopecten irradians]|uniref:beta-1,3-galactosyltransferase brn-like n=1 Tax=Argopecten irradians TaxID=31199 RepID=UPI0037224115
MLWYDLSDDYVPYSQFNYLLDMDFVKNYKEFQSTGKKPTTKAINPHPFHYIHLKKECNLSGKKSILILVKSAVNNFHLREAIRSTWGTSRGKNVEIVFLLAYNKENQLYVDAEVLLHGDIVQESFRDAYINNTYKTIMGFNWAVQYCDEASHVVFVDDDFYINVPNVLDYIDSFTALDTGDIMVGKLINSTPFRFFSKWRISKELYPFDKWPPYVTGSAFIMSHEAVKKLAFAFPYVKYLWIDDVYIGLVARKVGIEPLHESRLDVLPYAMYKNPLQIAYGEFKTLLDFQTVHRYLERYSRMEMCILTWKCQFAFLL